MTSGLRKSHIIIWIGILVFIPVLIVLSITNIPADPIQEGIQEKRTVEGTVLKSSENDYSVFALKETSSGYVIEINLIKPLKSSSSTVYELGPDNNRGSFIGQLETTGNYVFPSHKELKGIILFDMIKETEITKIQF